MVCLARSLTADTDVIIGTAVCAVAGGGHVGRGKHEGRGSGRGEPPGQPVQNGGVSAPTERAGTSARARARDIGMYRPIVKYRRAIEVLIGMINLLHCAGEVCAFLT
jgi:hypothetical protein